jgi:hypothetical protein
VNPDLAAPLSLYAAPLTDGLPAPVSCNLPIARPNSRVCTRADTRFLPEVERRPAWSADSHVLHGKISFRRHSHLNTCRPRPSRAISQSFIATVVHQHLFLRLSLMNPPSGDMLAGMITNRHADDRPYKLRSRSLLRSSTVWPFHSSPVSRRGFRFS